MLNRGTMRLKDKISFTEIPFGFEKYQAPSSSDENIFWPALGISLVAIACTFALGSAGDRQLKLKSELESLKEQA